MLNAVLNRLLAGHDLSRAEMETAMHALMAGEATAAQTAGFLVALRMKVLPGFKTRSFSRQIARSLLRHGPVRAELPPMVTGIRPPVRLQIVRRAASP